MSNLKSHLSRKGMEISNVNKRRVGSLNTPSATIKADGLHFKELNLLIKRAVQRGATSLKITGVNGQRYIGTGLRGKIKIKVDGVPGADLGAFMDGPDIVVNGNAQDAVGNTMNAGSIVVHGHASDVCGIAVRAGKIFIKSDVGYRAGIHMKEYGEMKPVLIIGGKAYDFLGEYMAGGILAVLNLNSKDKYLPSSYIGTGMHGGVIYIRGKVGQRQLGAEVSPLKLDKEDEQKLFPHLKEFARTFNLDFDKIINEEFVKLLPLSHRPYGRLYAY